MQCYRPRMDIDKLAWLHIEHRRVLMARSRGKALFYLPGGKREPGESDAQALVREIREELGVELVVPSLAHAGTFTDQADGQPAGVKVRLTAYFGAHRGALAPQSEIEEIAWMDARDAPRCSLTGRRVLAWLQDTGRID